MLSTARGNDPPTIPWLVVSTKSSEKSWSEFVSWDDFPFPIWWESHNPFMFQSPPTSHSWNSYSITRGLITMKSPNHQPGFSLNPSCQLHEMSAGTIHLGVTQDPPRQPLYSGCRWCRWIKYTLAKTTADKTTIEKHKPGSGNPFSTSSVVLRSLIFEHCKPASTSSFSQLEFIIVIPIINH